VLDALPGDPFLDLIGRCEVDRQFGGCRFARESCALFIGEQEIKRDVAQFESRSAVEWDHLLADPVALDAIGRADVDEFVAALDATHFRMLGGYGAAIDDDVIFTAAAEGDHLTVELEPVRLGIFFGNGDRDAWHGLITMRLRSF